MKAKDTMTLDTMKHLNRDDFLNLFGLETRQPHTSQVLPALAVFGVGIVVGTGIGMLVAKQSGKDLRQSIATSIQGVPDAIGGIPGRVNSAIHRATDNGAEPAFVAEAS
jgi:hypothetical protein